jgi:hypothetical protein
MNTAYPLDKSRDVDRKWEQRFGRDAKPPAPTQKNDNQDQSLPQSTAVDEIGLQASH